MLAGQGARIMARDYGWGVALWLLLMVMPLSACLVQHICERVLAQS